MESPKVFHLEMPLYHEFDLSIGSVAEKVFEILKHSETIDAVLHLVRQRKRI